ncbi:Calcium permeable stress-gated cation channel 1 [Phytophthora cinnamomi]|uniref:Calcium permeable stress-gated cation channel 1 n=1 Tax=Phytophthora cinnamomi TaxID=4785 RepID=UPI003559C7DF|nr:Calcium permeable stress-gated cation channel 1 [Phytophthora cinnamomi]
MPTSAVASEAVASVRSNRSRPGSSVASRGSKAPTEHSGEGDAQAQESTPTLVKVATVTLADRSTYHGEVNDVFGATYSGAMEGGKKHGAGVEMQANGTAYSGEFYDGVASGYGIYVGTLGDKYIGQWHDGARHGVGICVDAEAVMTTAHFNMDEPELPNSESGDSNLSWEDDVQPHVLRVVLAEKAAICNQETARQRHIDAVLQEMTAIGSETLSTPEAVEAFEAKEELETAEFIREQSEQMHAVNAIAGQLKFTEAQLTQRQKELRADITAKRQELSFVAKYCALAETREAQVREAQRTLASLQRQLDVLVPIDANAACETACHVPAEAREEF